MSNDTSFYLGMGVANVAIPILFGGIVLLTGGTMEMAAQIALVFFGAIGVGNLIGWLLTRGL